MTKVEKRKEVRIDICLDIIVHVSSCDEFPDRVGNSFPCKAHDLSPHGLRFISELGLPPGTLVNVTIVIEEPFSIYLLFGEVCWEFERDGKLMMGLRFLEKENSDLVRWIEASDSTLSYAA